MAGNPSSELPAARPSLPLFRDVREAAKLPRMVRLTGRLSVEKVQRAAAALARQQCPRLFVANVGRTDLAWVRDLPELHRLDVVRSDVHDVRALGAHAGSLQLLHLESGVERLDVAPAAALSELRQLYLQAGGEKKPSGVAAAIAGMSALEHLVLHRISLGDAGALHHLHRLRGIALKLGSATDLSLLTGLPELRFVEAWQVRGLVDLTALTGLPALEVLWLEVLSRAVVPDLAPATALAHVRIDKLPLGEGLAGLASAPALQQLCITRRLLDVDEVEVLRGHPTLAAASLPLRGRTVEAEGRLGLQPVHWAPFTAYGAGAMALPPEGWDGVYLQAEDELPTAADS